MKPERIAKVIAAAGVCSRRDAEKLIAEGRVALNNQTVQTPATLVLRADKITVDGDPVRSKPKAPRLWLYHKPPGLVVTHKDEKGRESVFGNLPKTMPRVVSVGRLDLNSEGLLLLTTSGELARTLELPTNKLKRVYRVRVRGTPTDKHLHMISRGVTVDDVKYKPIGVVAEEGKDGRNQWLTLTLTEGKNREIRRIFEHFDYPVSRLIRTGYGQFQLGNLQAGQVREVSEAVVMQLLKQLAVNSES